MMVMMMTEMMLKLVSDRVDHRLVEERHLSPRACVFGVEDESEIEFVDDLLDERGC